MTTKPDIPQPYHVDGMSLEEKTRWANDYYKQERQKESDAILFAGSRAVLNKSIDKKIMTTAVGSLDRIERLLGHLWGKDKTYLGRTNREKELFTVWCGLRRQILDLAEGQKKLTAKELDNYKILYTKFVENGK